MDRGFEGLMLNNVRKGLLIKKNNRLPSITLNVLRVDGEGAVKVTFRDVSELTDDGAYTLVGSCSIAGKEHSFEYRASPSGLHNSTVIGFLPVNKNILH